MKRSPFCVAARDLVLLRCCDLKRASVLSRYKVVKGGGWLRRVRFGLIVISVEGLFRIITKYEEDWTNDKLIR